MRVLWSYLEKYGRPLAFYTDKASLFQTAEKRKRDEPGVEKDPVEMGPTQIGRALRELGIVWIGAHSAQAKGRVERNFGTAQDRLVKGMRIAGVKTMEQANEYLTNAYLVWWERELTVEAANPDDAHRPLDKSHSLAASLCHMEARKVRPDYTLRWDGKLYQIERQAVLTGLRGAEVRVEQRLDGSLAVRYREQYLPLHECPEAEKRKPVPAKPVPVRRSQRRSEWNQNFDLKKGPKVWQAGGVRLWAEAGVTRQASTAIDDLDPRSKTVPCPALWLLVSKPGEPAQVPPVCTGAVPTVGAGQVFADGAGDRRQEWN